MHEELALLQLFMYSAPYMNIDIYILDNRPTLFCFSNCSRFDHWELLSWLLCPLYIPSLVCVCLCLWERERMCVSVCVVGGGRFQYLCQAIQDVSGSSYIFTIWILESAISAKNHGSFYYRTASEIKIQKADMLVDSRVSFLLCSLPGKARAYMCIY